MSNHQLRLTRRRRPWTATAALVLCAVTILNPGGILAQLERSGGIPWNPMIFVLIAVPVAICSGRNDPSVFVRYSCIFVGFFAIFGLIATQGSRYAYSATHSYQQYQIVLKPMICMIGIPFICVKAIRRDYGRDLMKIALLAMLPSCLIAIIQCLHHSFLPEIQRAPGRGSGLFINPNDCGLMLTLGLACVWTEPFKTKWHNKILSLLFIAGVMSTLSRAAMLCFVVANITFAMAQRNSTKLLIACVIVPAILVSSLSVVASITHESNVKNRLTSISALLTGDIERSADHANDRRIIYDRAIKRLLNENWLLGLGYGASLRMVQRSHDENLATHNVFLHIWATSGILSLLAFIALFAKCFVRARSKSTLAPKYMSLAQTIVIVFLLSGAFNDAIISHQHYGPMYGILAILLSEAHDGGDKTLGA